MSSDLTELEAVTLGCVASQGAVTAYQVRQRFLRSPSARFSGSAGAIYPLLKRLETRAFVSSRKAPTGKRPAREYSIMRAGRAALRAWLRNSLEPAEVVVDDPLRTRMLFLDQLSPAARLEWLDQAEQAVRDQTELMANYEKENVFDSPFAQLATENARRLNRARLAWLSHARERLTQE